MTPLRVVRTRAERAAREAALLAGTACEYCGDEGRVETRRHCFCGPDQIKSMNYTGGSRLVPREDDGGNPICWECWTPATPVRLCEGCRVRGGEEVGA